MSDITWKYLSERFRKLGEKTGLGKSSSYDLHVIFGGVDGDITVSLYTYDVGNWPRNTCLGQFDNEVDAKVSTLEKIIEAERIVELESNI